MNFKRGKRQLHLILLGIILLTFSGCISESFDDNTSVDDGMRSIMMTFKMPSANETTNTRSATLVDTDETAIKHVEVLAFKKEGTQWKFVYKAVGSNISDAPGGGEKKEIKRFNVTVQKDPNAQLFVVIANAQAMMDAFDWDAAVGTEKETLLKQLTFSLDPSTAWPVGQGTSFRPFPMQGESPEVIIKNDTEHVSGINLLRGIARVDVITSEEAQKNFKLQHIYVYNTKTKGYIAPNLIDGVMQIPAGAHNDYVSAEDPKRLEYGVADQISLEKTIYLLEATSKTVDDWTKTTCLVVGGSYEGGNTSWYRVDHVTPKAGSTPEMYGEFVRNHQYRFNIVSVSGPGYENPDIAFKERAINMEVVVKDWDKGDVGDIVFDGQHYISFIPSRSIEFGKEGGTRTVDIQTDILEGFQVTGVSHEDGTPMGTDGWLTIDPQYMNTSLGKGEQLVKLPMTAEADPTQERKAIVHVKAGRLNVDILVSQRIVTLSAFEFISMKNIDGQGLAIPRLGGMIEVTAKSNIQWTAFGQRGDNGEVHKFPAEKVDGDPEERTVSLDIDPLKRLWLDVQEMETKIKVWIEFEYAGKKVTAQLTEFYQVPYNISVSDNTPIPASINKYGEFIELELKGYFPEMPFRLVDESGNIASDYATAKATGDLVNRENLSTTIQFLAYSNYTGSARNLTLQYLRPNLINGVEGEEWRELKTVRQESNGLTLPTDGYKATRGVLGIGAKTGKLRLDGSYNFFGGTATYMDRDGVEKGEDVYMVCFEWGSLFALKASVLTSGEKVLVSNHGSAEPGQNLRDIIAWLPPGYLGDIDDLPVDELTDGFLEGAKFDQGSYFRIPRTIEQHLPARLDLAQGLGDPCKLAQDEASTIKQPSYGFSRTPWGVDYINHEAFIFYPHPDVKEEISGDGVGYYFTKNIYYEGDRQYLPAYGINYNLEYIMSENEDGEELLTIDITYRADAKGASPRRGYLYYWTSTTLSSNPMQNEAFVLKMGELPEVDMSLSEAGGAEVKDPPFLLKWAALPVRCVR